MVAVVCSGCIIRAFHLPMAATESSSSFKYGSHKPGFRRPQYQPLVMETEQAVTFKQESSVPSRRLILLRHAKSSWEDPSLKDHDRPLSKAGETDVKQVAYKLRQLDWIPELILSSDATRTRQTLKIMQDQEQAFLEAEIHFISSFYSVAALDGQTADHLQQAICKYARDEILTVMCMGHNRGWEEAASIFSGASVELKTCNAALLEAAGTSWEEVSIFMFSVDHWSLDMNIYRGISFGGKWRVEAPAISQTRCKPLEILLPRVL